MRTFIFVLYYGLILYRTRWKSSLKPFFYWYVKQRPSSLKFCDAFSHCFYWLTSFFFLLLLLEIFCFWFSKGEIPMKFMDKYKNPIIGLLLVAILMAEAWLIQFFERQSSITYEFRWSLMGWGLTFLTEIIFGFILCLWIIPRAWRLRQFSAIYLILFLGLICLTTLFHWGMFFPALAPESTIIALLNTLAGVSLFKGFFKCRSHLDDWEISISFRILLHGPWFEFRQVSPVWFSLCHK